MKTTALRVLPALIALALIAYFSPYATLYHMRRAIDDKDVDRFSDYVDFPSVRESVTAQLRASIHQRMSLPGMRGNPLAGIGETLMMGIIDPIVDTVVSPVGVFAMMNMGQASAAVKTALAGPDIVAPAMSPTLSASTGKVRYAITYRDWKHVELRPVGIAKDNVSFVLSRQGLWRWKLVSIVLPQSFTAPP